MPLSEKSRKRIKRQLAEFRDARLKAILAECGAYLNTEKTGVHYLLASGLHTNVFYDLRQALQHSDICELFSLIMLRKLEEENMLDGVNMLIGPERGAVPLIHTIKQYLPARNIRVVTIEKGKDHDGRDIYHVPENIVVGPDDHLLAFDDVFTTGGTLRAAIEACDAPIEGVGVCVNRAPKTWSAKTYMPAIRKVWIIRDPQEAYLPLDCPLCQAGNKVVKV